VWKERPCSRRTSDTTPACLTEKKDEGGHGVVEHEIISIFSCHRVDVATMGIALGSAGGCEQARKTMDHVTLATAIVLLAFVCHLRFTS